MLTLYGWAQFAKVWLALLAPEIGMRSMRMAQTKGERGFGVAGVMLIVVGLRPAQHCFGPERPCFPERPPKRKKPRATAGLLSRV